MYKFLQRNNKKLLAVFGVLLMIVFILPQVAFDNRNQASHVIAKITAPDGSEEEVHVGEAKAAHEQWQQITRGGLGPELGAVQFVAGEIDKHPELFYLLQTEARHMGLRVSEQQVDDAMARLYRAYQQNNVKPPADLRYAKDALANLLLVRTLFERVFGAVKLSNTLLDYEVAAGQQRVKLSTVHFKADDFKKTSAPTPADDVLQKHFDQFKMVSAGNVVADNPFGFGYLIPSRVKLLYLSVPADEIARAVRAEKTPFDWEVEARIKYRENPSKYVAEPATQPATTQSTFGPTSAPATKATSGPTTRPFEDVKDDIIKELVQPAVDSKVELIAAALRDRMNGDFQAVQKKSAGAPADFGTRGYLDRVAADVEKRFTVKLGIHEINTFKTEKELADLPGIGKSSANNTSFPQYVLRWADPFVPAKMKGEASVLSYDEPTPPFRDEAGNVYVAQVQEAELSHPPAKLDGVRELVEADLKTKLAYEAALAEAKKLHESISNTGTLAAAAEKARQDVNTTPNFVTREGEEFGKFEPARILGPDVELSETARAQLVRRAFELLAQASPDKPHPTAVIEIPSAGLAVVAELTDVERPWENEGHLAFFRRQIAQELTSRRAFPILLSYFKYDAVKRRLGYRSTDPQDDKPAETEKQTASAE